LQENDGYFLKKFSTTESVLLNCKAKKIESNQRAAHGSKHVVSWCSLLQKNWCRINWCTM